MAQRGEQQTGWYRETGVEIYSTEERPEIDSRWEAGAPHLRVGSAGERGLQQ